MKVTMKRHDKLSVKKRVVLTLVMLLLALCLGVEIESAVNKNNEINTEKFVYKVRAGDTMWSVGQKFKPEKSTMREYMNEIYRLNGRREIYPGDELIFVREVEKNDI